MLKKEISFLTDFNLSKLQFLGNKFSIDDLKKSNIHPAISQYISASIERQILQDRLNMTKGSSFDYSGERIKNYFSLIADEIKRTEIFDSSLIKQTITEAIIFNISFLTSPNKTLVNFIFDSSENKLAEEVINRISHAYYYRYVQKILFSYIDKKNIISISKDEFQNLLERIDAVSKETHLEDTLSTAVNSISNFLVHQSKSSTDIPLEAVKRYLEEKKLSEFISKLSIKYGEDINAHAPSSEIINVLLSVTPFGEIVIEETAKFEDELVNDDEENSELTNNEILEPVDEDEIPNNEILSSDKLVENNEVITEVAETLENIPEPSNKNITEKKTIDSDLNIDRDLKKKPKSAIPLDELVDLNTTYNSLAAEPKPFDNINQRQILDDATSSNNSDKLDYQIDTINIKDELDLAAPKSGKNKKPINNDLKDDIINDDKSDFSEAIDEVVNNKVFESEFIDETNEQIMNNIDSDEVQDLDNIISDEKLALLEDDEDEITEVFKDLSFLDKEDVEFGKESELVKPENKKRFEVIPEIDKAPQHFDEEHFSSFGELTSTKDMVKIIESIFDYDMEDYQKMINNISQSTVEEEALQIVAKYCKANHLDIHSKEIKEFKSYISQYFTKVMS